MPLRLHSRRPTASSLLLAAAISLGCAGPRPRTDALATASSPRSRVIHTSEVVWEHLNPKRGDKAPQAGTLWGDRNGPDATGYLLKPADGFRSPPHVHNVSYRGIVIRGLIHNDDPAADEHWMTTGSYWTQPKGDVHITAAQGDDTLAYIEIDEGPYLVWPVERAFATASEPVWIDAPDVEWTPGPDSVLVSVLWSDAHGRAASGTLVKLPPAFTGEIRGQGSVLHAVVIEGRPAHHGPGEGHATPLEPGSYFGSTESPVHAVSCEGPRACTIYARHEGALAIVPQPP